MPALPGRTPLPVALLAVDTELRGRLMTLLAVGLVLRRCSVLCQEGGGQ